MHFFFPFFSKIIVQCAFFHYKGLFLGLFFHWVLRLPPKSPSGRAGPGIHAYPFTLFTHKMVSIEQIKMEKSTNNFLKLLFHCYCLLQITNYINFSSKLLKRVDVSFNEKNTLHKIINFIFLKKNN